MGYFRNAAGFLFALGLSVALGCGDGKPPSEKGPIGNDDGNRPVVPNKIASPPPRAERIILVVIDTLRADRLGCMGYEKPTTPTLDSLSKQSILFERFYAASPWTAPSFGTLLTGVSPLLHRTGRWLKKGTEGAQTIGAVVLHPLNPGIATLAELLGDWSTSAFVTNAFLHEKLGFARGFDHYDFEVSELVGSRRADRVTERAIDWLEKHKSHPKFMSVIHYMDPHTAYDPLPRFKEKFAPGKAPSDMVRQPFGPSRKELRGFTPTTQEKNYIKGLYDGEVRFVDDQIGVLIEAMKRLDMLNNTWLVVTSDHGEEHFDHGRFNHGFQYEDEVVRVPLLVRAPGGKWGAGNRVRLTASHVDLLPTLLEIARLEPPEHLEGRSLFPLMKGEETSNRPVYMEYQLFGKQHYAYTDGRFKIVKSEDGETAFMYDLQSDPKEMSKLFGQHPAFVGTEKAMENYRKNRIPRLKALPKHQSPSGTLPKNVTKALRELGYVE